jgi:hypothetical protein
MSLVDELREWEQSDFPLADSAHACELSLGEEISPSLSMAVVFDWVANRIEREYLPRPVFEGGDPIQFGDALDIDGRKFVLASIEYRSDDKMQLMNTEGQYTQPLHNREFKRYIEDTQEKINKDAKKPVCIYFNGNVTPDCSQCVHYDDKSFSCEQDMIQDLLARQRKLDGVE